MYYISVRALEKTKSAGNFAAMSGSTNTSDQDDSNANARSVDSASDSDSEGNSQPKRIKT